MVPITFAQALPTLWAGTRDLLLALVAVVVLSVAATGQIALVDSSLPRAPLSAVVTGVTRADRAVARAVRHLGGRAARQVGRNPHSRADLS